MTATSDPPATVTLSDPGSVCVFKRGASADIAELSEAEACAIFGRPLYEHWLATKDDRRPKGTVTVTSIDRCAGTLTLDAAGKP